jgi:hypothetical protein
VVVLLLELARHAAIAGRPSTYRLSPRTMANGAKYPDIASMSPEFSARIKVSLGCGSGVSIRADPLVGSCVPRPRVQVDLQEAAKDLGLISSGPPEPRSLPYLRWILVSIELPFQPMFAVPEQPALRGGPDACGERRRPIANFRQSGQCVASAVPDFFFFRRGASSSTVTCSRSAASLSCSPVIEASVPRALAASAARKAFIASEQA